MTIENARPRTPYRKVTKRKKTSHINEELSSMLSFVISHLSSTTSVEEVSCRLRHPFFRHLVSSWACSSVIKRNFAANFYINAGE